MLKSPVYRITIPDQWGVPQRRKRCCFDGKVVLRRQDADKVARRMGMEAYLGDCGWWHVGHASKWRLASAANRLAEDAEAGQSEARAGSIHV